MSKSNIPTDAWELAEEAYPLGGEAAATEAIADYHPTPKQIQTHMHSRRIKYIGPPRNGTGASQIPSTTRRCRNKLCIERFVPINTSHWYHEPACAQAEYKWEVKEILTEEGGLAIGARPNEMAKRAFGQKNDANRKVLKLTSMREFFAYLIEDLIGARGIGRIKAVPIPKPTKGNLREIIVVLSDWQLGKLEVSPDGQKIGVKVMEEKRLPRIMDAVVAVLGKERAAGHRVDTIRMVFAGDMIEGCFIYRGQNVSGLDRTSNTHRLIEQIELCARLQAEMAVTFAAHVPKVIVESVPGNHGRVNARTEFADNEDNFDTLAVRWAATYSVNQKNIEWSRNDNWFTSFEVLGHPVTAIHGDKWRSTSIEPLDKLLKGWVLADLFPKPELFITAHRHNYQTRTIGNINVIQNGTIDGGSNYFTESTGMTNPPMQAIVVASEARVAESYWPVDFR